MEMVAKIEDGIEATTEKYDVQVRFRMDEKKRVPYSRSGETWRKRRMAESLNTEHGLDLFDGSGWMVV